MFPLISERVLGFSVRSYSVFAAIGLAISVVVIMRAGLRAGLDKRKLVDMVLVVIITSLIGSKLAMILIEWTTFADEPWADVYPFGLHISLPRALVLWQGGLFYYGGLLVGAVTAVIYARRKGGMSVGQAVDVIAPGVALGHVWGRLGCLLEGCCFGKATDSGLGVVYRDESQAFEQHASRGLLQSPFEATYPLHPVQIYEAAVELAVAGALIFLLARWRRFAGQLAMTYLVVYSFARFGLEFFRGDRTRGFFGDPIAAVQFNRWIGVDGGSPTVFSVSQVLAFVVVLGCGFLWLMMLQKPRRSPRTGVKVGDDVTE